MAVKATSDLHFGHDNIIRYCKRPCTTENHIDYLISILNEAIGIDDVVYHLGDFSYQKKLSVKELHYILTRLNGTWYFILGNHDDENRLRAMCQNTKHKVLSDYHTVRYKDRTFVLFHYPIERWWNDHRGSVHLHGHIHNHPMRKLPNRHNVCFDREFKVYDFDEFLIDEREIITA